MGPMQIHNTGWCAAFDGRGDLEVVAFRERDGAAMVMDVEQGRIVPAADVPGFAELRQTSDPVLGVLPGEGWTVAGAAPQGTRLAGTRAVVAFLVRQSGVEVFVTDGVGAQSFNHPDYTLIPPSE
jgi:hypothetical protein